MSQDRIFKLLQPTQEVLHIPNSISESEPFTISKSSFNAPEQDDFINSGSSTSRLKLEDGRVLPGFLKDNFDFEKFACKPLREVDEDYVKEQTFLTIGTNGRIHRFAASQSLFILNPANPLRRAGIYLLSHWYLAVLIGISLCFLCCSLVLPNYAENSDEPHLANVLRYFATVVVVGEIFVKIVARGVFVAQFTYLRSSWDWLDVIMISSLIFGFFWKNPLIHSLQGISLLKFIPLVPAFKDGFKLFIKTLKNLAPALIYSFLIFWILILLGFKITNYNSIGSFQTSCRNLTNETFEDFTNKTLTETSNFTEFNDSKLENNFNKSSMECSSTNNNNSLFISTLQFIEVVSVQFLSGTENNKNFVQKYFTYTLITLLLGTCGFITFALAGVTSTFVLLNQNNLDQRHSNGIKKQYSCLTFCLPKSSTANTSPCDDGCALLNKLNSIMNHPFTELMVTVVIVFDILFVFLSLLNIYSTPFTRKLYFHGSKVCMILYVIELIFKLVSSRYGYFKNPWNLLDAFVVVIFTIDQLFHPLTWILPIRIFKITPFWLTLHKFFEIIAQTFKSKLNLIVVILILCLTFEVSSRQLINNDNSTSIILFVFKDWTSTIEDCTHNNRQSLCLILFFMEGLLVILLFLVIFISVMCSTNKVLKNPSELLVRNKLASEAIKTISLKVSQLINRICNKSSQHKTDESRLDKNSVEAEINHTVISNGILKHSNNNQEEPHENNLGIESSGCGGNDSSIDTSSEIPNYLYSSCIFAATLALAVDFDTDQRINPFHNPRLWIDLIFLTYCFGFLVWTFFTKGFNTLGNLSWIFDFVVLSASGFTLYVSILNSANIRDLPGIKFVATISSLRGMMLITRLEILKRAALGLIVEIRMLVKFLLAYCVILIFIFSLKYEMLRSHQTMLSFFHPSIYAIISKLFKLVLFGTLFGVISYQLLKQNNIFKFMTSAQLTVYKSKESRLYQEKILIIPYPKNGLCTHILHYLTQTDGFELAVAITIICDCLVITFSHLAESKDWQIIWSHYPPVIISVYCIELYFKAVGWRNHFLKSWWNLFDCLIVAISIFDLLIMKIQIGPITSDFLRFLRILDIFHLNFVQRNAKAMELFLTALVKSVSPVGNLILLYLVVIHSYSSIGFVNLRNAYYAQNILESFGNFKTITKALVLIPFYDDFGEGITSSGINPIYDNDETDERWIAQFPLYSKKYYTCLFTLHSYSYLGISYLILGTICAILVNEMVKESKNFFITPYLEVEAHENGISSRMYKCRNGLLPLYSTKFGGSNDDHESMDTALTPLSEIHLEDRIAQLNDSENDNPYNCPVKISANGYILHVEAIVTTV